jgi:thiamine biosynthesis lipoprotein
VKRALIEAGGDIVVGDPPPGETGWRIEVANADAKDRFVTLANAAISTSGDTEQFVEIGGQRYSHVVDPKTGYGLTDRMAATVIAPNGITSDGLSTAFCLMGPERGKPLLKRYPGVKAYVRRASDSSPSPHAPKPNPKEGFERPG